MIPPPQPRERTRRARVGQPQAGRNRNGSTKNPPRPRGATGLSSPAFSPLPEPAAPAWGNPPPPSSGRSPHRTRRARVGQRLDPKLGCPWARTRRARVGQPSSSATMRMGRGNPPRPRGATKYDGANTMARANPPRPRGATAGGRCCWPPPEEPAAPAWGNRAPGRREFPTTGTRRARVGQPPTQAAAISVSPEPAAPAWGNALP